MDVIDKDKMIESKIRYKRIKKSRVADIKKLNVYINTDLTTGQVSLDNHSDKY